MYQALIFANGDVNDGPMVRQALREAAITYATDGSARRGALVVAADGGARVAGYFGLRPQVVIGDMDSLTADEVTALAGQKVNIVQHPAEKDATDLELALNYAVAQGAGWIRVIGGIGDRFDQTLGNILLLALPSLAACDVCLVAGKQKMWLMRPGQHTLHGAQGDTLSLLPLGGDAQGVTTEGLYYPLRDEALIFGPARGISNVLTAHHAIIRHRAGLLLAIHTVGRA
jgi:thiamine pyrophosphokinase